jgi:hypothetical protein
VRQVVGYVAYLITGGLPTLLRLSGRFRSEALSYETLAFEGDKSPLFEAVRSAFDPAFVTHPEWDAELWSSASDSPQQNAPPDPADFRAIKRRFYFEHPNGAELLRRLPRDEAQFETLLGHAQRPTPALTRHVTATLNRYFDSSDTNGERLALTAGGHADVGEAQARWRERTVPFQQLHVRPLCIADWATEWLGPYVARRARFALDAARYNGERVARLEVDRDVYLTLADGGRGLGRAMRSDAASQRVASFVKECTAALD